MTPETMTLLVAAGSMFAALGGLIVGLFLWLRADMQNMRGELRADMQRMRGELREEIGAVETGLRADIQALDRKVDELGERVTQLGERVARVEGKLEFLLEFITRRNDLPPPAPAE